MRCAQCAAENPAANRFCGSCGARLEAPPVPVPVPDDPGAFYCERHKSVSTRVRCSRCGAPICPRCMVPAPVGIQCRKCASQRAPLRPRGVIHAAGRTISAGAAGAGRAVWYLSLWAFLISIVRGFFGGRDT